MGERAPFFRYKRSLSKKVGESPDERDERGRKRSKGGDGVEKGRLWWAESWSVDPWENLAMEECLWRRTGPGEVGLFLWQNRHTVVIGRHQNPWKECRVDALERDGGRLARRLSGGGAVYHDLGNLNFTFFLGKGLYDFGRQLEVIARAVRSLGIPAEVSGRNDLLAEGRKFSGNAYFRGKHADFHHGTLLVDVDLGCLERYLHVSPGKLEGKGVASVRSRVVNLKEMNSRVDGIHCRRALREAFEEEYGELGAPLSLEDVVPRDELVEVRGRYGGDLWRFGRTPPFSAAFERRFPWGQVELHFDVVSGVVRSCALFSDALDGELMAQVPRALERASFDPGALVEALTGTFGPEGPEEIEDMKNWLASAPT